jgi:uncharacterized membrane protein
MIRWFIAILLILFTVHFALAATIVGTVYDVDFEPLQNVVVKIDTAPEQTYVAKVGTYSFDATSGEYTISASIVESRTLTLFASESITIEDDGRYVVDLFTFPEIVDEEELEILEDADLDIESPKNPLFTYILLVLGLIVSVIGVYYFLKRKRNTRQINDIISKNSIAIDLPEDLQELVSIIQSNGGRMSQKDVRKQLPLSEGKVSLMVSDLEDRKILKRIKKGRANILILTR